MNRKNILRNSKGFSVNSNSPSWDVNWKGDKSLPLAFAPFLMLWALLMGEVMPVVIGIFGGVFGTYGAKEPIIKTLPDFGVVLIIYVLLGFLFWILYRYINWRIVMAFGFVLAFSLERFVYAQVEGSINLINSVSVGTFIEFIIIYFLVLMLPYFIFQRIRSKGWKHGIVIALVILLVLNALGLGFTAHAMVQKGMFPYDQYFRLHNLSGKESSSQESLSGTRAYTNLTMIVPYVKERDIRSINEAFSNTENSPWGFKHAGIDFMSASDLIPIQAVASGTIEKLSSSKENEQQGWHTELCISHNPLLICYNFETFSPEDSIGKKQSTNIFVKNGQTVKQGDVIGNLVRGGDGAHIDFGVLLIGGSGARVCPEQYFTADAKASIMKLIHKDHLDWKMCYE